MQTKGLVSKRWYFTRCFLIPMWDLVDRGDKVTIRSRFLRSAFYKITGRGPTKALAMLSPDEYFEMEFQTYVSEFFNANSAYDLYPILGIVGNNSRQAARALWDMREFPTEPLARIVDRICERLYGECFSYATVQDGLLIACAGWPSGDPRYGILGATLEAGQDEAEPMTLDAAIKIVKKTESED